MYDKRQVLLSDRGFCIRHLGLTAQDEQGPTGQSPSGHQATGREHLGQQGLEYVQAQRVPDHGPELPIADMPVAKVMDTDGQSLEPQALLESQPPSACR
jgi:hypothetical protein